MALGDHSIDPCARRKQGGRQALPQDGHPRRCQASLRKHGGGQCKQWASKNRNYCRFHGGHGPAMKRHSLYTRKSAGKLKALLTEMAANADERIQLQGEVDAARAIAVRAMRVYGAALDSDSDKVTEAMKHSAAAVAQGALTHVASLVEKACKVMALSDAAMDAQQVQHLLVQVQRVIEDHVDDEAVRAAITADFERLTVAKKKAAIQITI